MTARTRLQLDVSGPVVSALSVSSAVLCGVTGSALRTRIALD